MSEKGKVSKYKGKNDATYYRIRISLCGKLQTINNHKGVPFDSAKHARAVLAQLRGRLADGELTEEAALAEFLPRPRKPDLVTKLLRDFLAARATSCRLGTFSENTLRSYRTLIPERDDDPREGCHFRWFAGKTIHDVREPTLRRFQRYLEELGLGPRSVELDLSVFQAFMSWCKEEEKIKSVPAFPKVESVKKTPKLLTPVEQRKVLNAIPWAIRGIFLAMCLGIRPNAARALRVEDVADGGLFVRRAVQGSSTRARTADHTKARKENWVPMTRELHCWVAEHTADRLPAALLFWNPNGRTKGLSWPHDALRYQWKIASQRAGVKHVPLYKATKHSFATARLMQGVPKEAIADFMQISPAIVDVYAQYARELSTQVLPEAELSDAARAMRAEMLGQVVPEPWTREAERERERAREAARTERLEATRKARRERLGGGAARLVAKRASGEPVANRGSALRKPAKPQVV